MIYVDDTVAASELAGILVLVGVLWALWASTWLVRVELHALAAPIVARLGLRWSREGLMPWVRAVSPDGALVLRFRRGEGAGSLKVERRLASGWETVEPDAL